MRARSARIGKILLALVLALPAMAGLGSTVTNAGTPSGFAAVRLPVGLAGRYDALFVTTHCQQGHELRQVLKIDRTGAVSVFTTLPSREGCFEEYIAVALKLGSFLDAAGALYVTQGRTVVEVAPNGSGTRLFYRLPSTFPDSNVGITFDWIGTWNHDMLLVGGSQVLRVRREPSAAACAASGLAAPCGVLSAAPITLMAGGGPVPVGGPPSVAPTTFAPCPGGLLAASETYMGGAVFCVMPSGATGGGPLALMPGAKGVHFIQPNPCAFGPTDLSPPDGVFFSTVFRQNGSVVKFPATDFTSPPQAPPGLDGRAALVTSGTGAGIGLLSAAPPAPPALLPLFQTSIGDHRGSDFCGRHRERILVRPISDRTQGSIPVTILSSPGFNPHVRVDCGPGLRFGRIGNEPSFSHCTGAKSDDNGDGVPDLTVHFNMKLTNLQPGDRGWLTGLYVHQSPQEGFVGGD